MTRLSWNNVGERFFEAGVDRGVLYVGTADGVPWNGLVSVDESPSGGELQAYYMDGVHYLSSVSPEAFEATLTAFYSPPEFDPCDGNKALALGLSAGRQKRVPFGLSYRTMLGNDVDGQSHGYKIHILYNLIAGPAPRSYSSIDDNPDPMTLSWKIISKPESIAASAPSAYLILNTMEANPGAVSQLEDILYGTSTTPPRLPLPAEVISVVNSADLIITLLSGGQFSATGPAGVVDTGPGGTFTLNDPDVIPGSGGTYVASSP